jgi:L-fuculose-phosphate aldolase
VSPPASVEPPQETAAREALCQAGRALHQRGLLAGTAGNLSVRLDARSVLLTPRSARKDRLAPSDLVLVEPAHPEPEALARASTEWPMHRACYEASDLVRAVVHTHAPALTAAGIRGLALTDDLPELGGAVGKVSLVDFQPSGSEELGEAVGRAVAMGAAVLLLRNHGAVTVAASLDAALDRMELAELSARAVLLARG